MNAPYSPLEFALLNDWQHDLPLVARPFAAMASVLDASEQDVISRLQRLTQRGAISRVGAVFAPWRVGVSTLAAMAVPRERLEAVAALVSASPAVNHNYQREHHYNLWFVATAASDGALAQVLAQLAALCQCEVLSLPLVEQFHIDLGFDLGNGAKSHRCAGRSGGEPLADGDRPLVAALEPGLPLESRPYQALGRPLGLEEGVVRAKLQSWLASGIIKRLGVVVRHHELGYRANAMVVFDVPDDEVAQVGQRLAGESGVTLCYRRRRQLPQWHYNLYCMVHGRSREEVAPLIAGLQQLADYPSQILFSTRRFKQCGARYFHD